MWIISYLYASLVTTLNIFLYFITLTRFILFEGRIVWKVFRNWGLHFRYRPPDFEKPRSEGEIISLIQNSASIRVFGAGHSFNSGNVTEETLVSLDNYRGVIWVDRQQKQMAVRGGTRIREVNQALLEEGWAFVGLPSYDAQSIAGIISTDTHGTGRDWGFVSQSVVKIKVIDGRGQVIECEPADELFKAAIGGIGAVGIISEVVVQAVDRFNVEQKTQTATREDIVNNLDRLLKENEHLSLYIFPFTDKLMINTWNSTDKPKTFLGPLRELVDDAIDALMSAWGGDLIAHLGLLPKVAGFVVSLRRGTDLILESAQAFNRTLYYLHWELEFTVPYEEALTTIQRFVALYEEMYPTGLPLCVFEIRFTPAGHNRTLIGPGRDRRSTWININVNDSKGWDRFYDAAEKLMEEVGARPHLGKYDAGIAGEYLAEIYGQYFTSFLEQAQIHDPEGKFTNPFTQRLFGTVHS